MEADVAIIGFGPVGAVLAGLLGRRGLRVIIFERDTDVFPLPRAAHVDHTGLRALQELGCLDQILANVIRNKGLELVNRERRLLARVAADQDSVSGLPTSVYFYQPEFDQLLRRTVGALDTVAAHLGSEVIAIEPCSAGVALVSRGRDGTVSTTRASWVIGCDGATSWVRAVTGIELESFDFNEHWLVLDLRMGAPHPTLPSDRMVAVCDPARPYLSTPISPGRQRIELMLRPGENVDAVRQPQAIARLLDACAPGGCYDIERAAVYTFHGLVARQWRQGRVLIAGDAAHQTPPFLGQGMCAGIRDATNLAWKLARVIRAGAPLALLDTYQSERSPHAAKVIKAAIRIGQVVCELDPARAAARDCWFVGDPRAAEELAFTLPRLDPGPLILEGGGKLFVQPIVAGKRLDDLVGPRFLVLGRTRCALGPAAAWWESKLDAVILTLDRLDNEVLRGWLDRHQADALVVRPDRYVLGAAGTLEAITAPVDRLLADENGGDPSATVRGVSGATAAPSNVGEVDRDNKGRALGGS